MVFFPGLLGLSDFLEKTGICEDTLVVVAETIGNEEVDVGCEAIFQYVSSETPLNKVFVIKNTSLPHGGRQIVSGKN